MLSNSTNIYTTKEITVDVLITELYLKINGGENKIIDFKKEFYLNSISRDYEVQDENSP